MSLEQLKKLRELTGAGMQDCKNALTESNNNLEEAKELIKKQGLLVGVLRGAKDTKEGIVIATTTKDTPEDVKAQFGTIICLSCETEPVANMTSFMNLAEEVSMYSVINELNSIEELVDVFNDKVVELLASIKENILISHYTHLDGEHIAYYNHHNKKLSVLVAFNKEYDEEVGKNVAMQIASMRPLFVDHNDIPKIVLDKEKQFAFDKTKEDMEGKPDDIIEKASEGRFDKEKNKMTLLNQVYTQGEKKQTVRQYLESVDKELKVLSFRSFQIG